MIKIGMDLPHSRYAYNMDEALEAAEEIGFPIIIRASFTLAGGGSGVCGDGAEIRRRVGVCPQHDHRWRVGNLRWESSAGRDGR